MVSFFKTLEIDSYHLINIAVTISRFIIFRDPILLTTAVHYTFWAVLHSKFPIVKEF